MKKYYLAILFLYTSTLLVQAQNNNYTPIILGNLPQELNESSGLLYYNGALWSINDGGNEATLYKIDTTAPYTILQTFVLENTNNTDWEGLAQDEHSFYIGDFGNNAGNRQDLRILKLDKNQINTSINQTDTIRNIAIINFSFSDQVDFNLTTHEHNFDCEAFIYYQDSIYIFSKNWVDKKTRIYHLPTQAGNYTAILKDSFNTQFAVTDASIDSTNKNLILIGYNGSNGNCFAYTFRNFQNRDFFSGNNQRLNLPHLITSSQIEGVTFFNAYSGWISGENFNRGPINIPATLQWFDLSEYFQNAINDSTVHTVRPRQEKEIFQENLSWYPNPISKTFKIDFSFLEKGIWHFDYFAINGILLAKQNILVSDNIIELNLPDNIIEKGFYLLQVCNTIYKFNLKLYKE